MIKFVYITLLLLLSSNSSIAQENAIERTLPTTSGMSIIAWIFIALIIAAGIIWTLRGRRGQKP